VSKEFIIKSFAISDVGLVRKNNEDSFRELPKEQFYVLADGMGGHQAGEVASSRAVEYMCSAMQTLLINKNHSFPLEDLQNHVQSVIANTNLWVHHLGVTDPSLAGMGTTLCSLLFHQNFVIYSHVGDSRIYRIRQKKINQLTSDHVVNYQFDLKRSSDQFKVPLYSHRKVLAQAIGTSLVIRPEIGCIKGESGDLYLMCSDGLSDLVSNEEIEAIVACNTSNLKDAADSLVNRAKARGGIDNITVVLVSLEP
jgi:serine/threonine protein phosphatase PrpC